MSNESEKAKAPNEETNASCKTPCYYRNKADLESIESISVDEQSLWVWNRELGLLVLDDDDQHVTHKLTDQFVKTL